MVWNPYTQTLKLATMPQTLENWYATIGTEEVSTFYLRDGHGATCIYSERIEEIIPYGVQFQNWKQPVIGVLLFVGPPDGEGETTDLCEEAVAHIRKQFATAAKGPVIDLKI